MNGLPGLPLLLSPSFLGAGWSRLSVVYLLAVVALLLYWLGRIWRNGRQARVPGAAWWGLPGVLLLLYAAVLEQPTFFALGAFALLLAEFWPRAYRQAGARPAWFWPLLGLILGTALLAGLPRQSTPQPLVTVTALALLLAGLAGLTSTLAWRALRLAQRPTVWPRWAKTMTPEWPDLSISLTGEGAELKNISSTALALAGWSPASMNGWLLIRDGQGQPIWTLEAGQTALLPLNEYASGVRVWYSPADSRSDEARLFRADWTPTRYQSSRVLN